MRTLRKGTPNELKITELGNMIIVETKQDIIDKKYRKERNNFLLNTSFLLISSMLLGMCVMYLILKH